jgi:hypothetical protein
MIKRQNKQGRSYTQLRDIKAGTKLQFDGDFGCLTPDFTYVARMDGDVPYVNCAQGIHTLDVQAHGNGGYCVGVYRAEEVQ